MGCREGAKIVDRMKDSDVIKRFSFMASIVGLTMVGGLICQLVQVKLGLDVKDGEDILFSLQGLLDGILPNMLPLGITLLCFFLMKRKKIKPLWILAGIVAVSVLGSLAGIFVIPG
jgi:mannose/fructose/N-acetylgalactosamine-specific phosphotransferase system component IID